MDRDSASWLHEATKFYLMYLAVGAVFVPFGLVYGLLVLQGWDHWLFIVFLLGAGFLAGRYVWGKLERRLFVNPARVIQGVPASASRAVPELVRQGGVTELLEPLYARLGENGWPMPRVVDHQPSGVSGSLDTIPLTA